MLVLDDVSKCFSRADECVLALDNVSLQVAPGEIAMVVGGALDGKTTLLQIAAATERPNRGSVLLDGRELTSLSDHDRATLLGRDIMWVNPEGPAIDVDLASFVGWPLSLHGHRRRHTEQTAAMTLARVGMLEHARRKWHDLSHRQQTLAGLARAFAADPRLIVIDDVLDGLGSRATEDTVDLLRSLIEESPHRPGVLLSVSEMESTTHADRVLSIYKGVVEPMTLSRHSDAEVIPFPGQNRRRESHGVGAP